MGELRGDGALEGVLLSGKRVSSRSGEGGRGRGLEDSVLEGAGPLREGGG